MIDNTIQIDRKKDLEDKAIQFMIKRLFDIIMSLIAIIILLPVYIIIGIAIRIDSKGNVLFKQIRVGKDEKLFTIYKFRTMIVNAEKRQELQIDVNNLENFVFQSKSDNRITKVGAFLRKTSLDEIPQFFNVLFGTMSLVGPRPEIPDVVKYYTDEYKQRLLVTPGITGLAQVSGRGEIELGKTIKFDLTYIKKFSVWFDLEIIVKTVTSVFKKEGAF